MTRPLLLALLLASCTAQTQPAPCVTPSSERIELHDAESITAAGLEAFYGKDLDGGPTRD